MSIAVSTATTTQSNARSWVAMGAQRKSAAKNAWTQSASCLPTSESESQLHPTRKKMMPKESPPTTPRKMAPTTILSSWPVPKGRRRPLYRPTLHLRSRQSRWFDKSVQQQARLHDRRSWLLTSHFPLGLSLQVLFLFPLDPLTPVLLYPHWSFYFQSLPFSHWILKLQSLFYHWSFYFQSFPHSLELLPLAIRKEGTGASTSFLLTGAFTSRG